MSAAVAMRAYAQERPWFPGDAGPDALAVQRRLGLASLEFDRTIPASWRSYYTRMLDDVVSVLMPVTAGALCYLGLHWLLCPRKVPFVAQLPGALFVGLSWYVLLTLAEWYVGRFVVRSSDTYGVFVVVFGLLSWAYLLGTLYLYGNELSSVLYEHRWPRSLTGRNLTEADRAAFARVSEREVRVRGTDIAIDVPTDPAPPPER